jgi:hypothetical protein
MLLRGNLTPGSATNRLFAQTLTLRGRSLEEQNTDKYRFLPRQFAPELTIGHKSKYGADVRF